MKKYSLIVVSFCICCMIIAAVLTVYVDPYFHYHKPNNRLNYVICNERYQNNGIMRHFDYTAMITGTSMTENFKTSEFDALFQVNSIKVPFSGASYKEVNDNVERAIKYNPKLKIVLRSIDCSMFFTSAEWMSYDENDLPKYLTNDNIFDDVYYLLNKQLFVGTVCPMLLSSNEHGSITNFDTAYNWNSGYLFGKESVMLTYNRENEAQQEIIVNDIEIEHFKLNIEQNLVEIVKENPNIDFYYFLTPYSILYWDDLNQKGMMQKHLLGEKLVIETLLPYDNVYLFSFNDDFSIITNLQNYKDIAHYGEWINSYILDCMKNDEHRLTEMNYIEYLNNIEAFYTNYDYDRLFE